MKKHLLASLAGIALATVLPAQSASAAAINWTDWTSAVEPVATGTLTFGATSVGVTLAAPVQWGFAQTNGGTDYWTGSAYTISSVNERPTGTDLIALDQGGTVTINFSQAVLNPYLALLSWNYNSFTSPSSFTVVSQGCGYWGCGSAQNLTSNSFNTSGELHGILQFQGTFTSLSFTSGTNYEFWHGVQVGADAVGAVPEPATWAMMLLGFAGIGFAMRRRRTPAQLLPQA